MKAIFPHVVASALFLPALTTHGAILATYDFLTTGTTNNALSASNVTTPTSNYTVTDFTAGAGLQGSVPGSNPAFSIAGASETGLTDGNTRHMFVRIGGTDSANASDQAGAVAAQDYYSFIIGPAEGYTLNLTSLTFDIARSVSSTVFIRSSLDDFAGTIGLDTSSATGTTLSAATPVIFGSAFQEITSAIELRFYFADGSDSTTNTALVSARLDNIVLNGEVSPIPEPSSALLLGIAAVPLAASRRRKRIMLR